MSEIIRNHIHTYTQKEKYTTEENISHEKRSYNRNRSGEDNRNILQEEVNLEIELPDFKVGSKLFHNMAPEYLKDFLKVVVPGLFR